MLRRAAAMSAEAFGEGGLSARRKVLQ